MKPNQPDLVGEYLHEVDLRLSGLPLLQRRELLADLAAHIATERTERNVQSEGELIEILERLGSPEVVAAAAYEEAGAPRMATTVPPPPSYGTPPPSYGTTPPSYGAPFDAMPSDAPRPVPPAKPSNGPKVGVIVLVAIGIVGFLIFICGFFALASRSDQAPQPAVATVAPPEPTTPASPATP